MARLQILELPEGGGDDRPPFVLVVDQYEPVEATPSQLLRHEDIAEKIGARAVLVFEETIDIPANDTTAYLSGGKTGRTEYDEALTRVRAEVARIRTITPTWGPVADLIDAALNGTQQPAERSATDA